MPLYEWECPSGHVSTEVRKIERRDDLKLCPACNLDMHRVPSIPVVQTLSTHLKGFEGYNPAHGGYVDPNLFDRKTGKHEVVTSLKHKQQLLQKHGLFEKGPSDARKRRERQTKYSIPT